MRTRVFDSTLILGLLASVLLVGCTQGKEPVSPVTRFASNLEFGMSMRRVRALRPKAQFVEYAGLVEATQSDSLASVTYRFVPSEPEWIERVFGRLTTIEIVMSSRVTLDSVRESLEGELGRPTSSWCAPVDPASPNAELRYVRWDATDRRAQVVTLRTSAQRVANTDSIVSGPVVVALDLHVARPWGLSEARQRCFSADPK
jgi:hypothetical protein